MTELAADPDVAEDAVVGITGSREPVMSGCADLDIEDAKNTEEYTERPLIPVQLLTAHPGNVREDRKADQAFCRSVASVGVLVPLEITVDPDGGYRVVDGNIRLDAAIKTGQEAVPYLFSADTADDEGLQYLHMLITSRFRKGLSVQEEAQALFEASKLMTRTEIRKATGLSASEVKAGVRAGGLGTRARELAAELDYEWTLEELALLRPFEDDPEAMETIRRSRYSPIKYTVQRLLDEREAKNRRAKLLAELARAGTTVTDDRPQAAVPLHRLLNGEDEMDPEAHADCPGHGAWIGSWHGASPNFYCLDPVAYGHVFAETGTTSPPEPAVRPTAADRQPAAPAAERKIVVEGNKAWVAAGTVRQQWLAEFLTRKSPPKNVAATIARFVTEQLVTMPEPLCRALGGARHSRLFESFGKPTTESVVKSAQPGLWMIALAPVATAYEREITGDGERRNTWREDRYSPCTREDAGAWLRFVAEIGAKHGYEPSPIEKAVADGTPYLGDDPVEVLIEETGVEAPEGDLEGSEHDDQPMCAGEQASRWPASTEAAAEADADDEAFAHDPDAAAQPTSQDHLAAEVIGDTPEVSVTEEAA